MSGHYKDEFEKRFKIVVSIFFDAVTLIIVLLCFYLINYAVKFLGFENEIVALVIHEYIHPIMLLSIFSISIINIFHEHLPKKKDSKARFEIIHDNDKSDKLNKH